MLYRDSPERHRNQRRAHDQQVEQIERGSTERAVVYDKTVGDHFQPDLDRKHCGEKIVEIQ